MASNDLHLAINEYCQSKPYKIAIFAEDCGMEIRQLYRVFTKNGGLKPNEIEAIAEKLGIDSITVELLVSKNKFKAFKIKHLDDETKPRKSVAGKICWNPKLKAWEYQIMLYNQLLEPPEYTHPVWLTLSKYDFPDRSGTAPWENHQYFRFTIEK